MSSILLATLALGLAAPLSDAPRFGEVKLSTGIRMHYAEQGESRADHPAARLQRFVVLLQPSADAARA
jgi:hypothetical protein